MPTVLCAWELGGNLGHLSNLRLPIEMALASGHQVVLALRELHRAKEVFGDMPITYLQAPFKQNATPRAAADMLSYTHLLGNQCFSSSDELGAYLQAWRALYRLVRPDVVLFEHSPTALIAASDQTFKKVLVGTGFSVPPLDGEAGAPFLPFPTTPLTPLSRDSLLESDQHLLAVVNRALQDLAAPPLASLQAIYAQADATLLMTWPELDPFGPRRAQAYVGIEAPLPRPAPQWPPGPGAKVFAYLDAIPSLETLLRDLSESGVCALLHVRNMPAALAARFTSERMRFVGHPVDLSEVARQASWVISLGNHNTTAAFALAGLPQLLIPMHQEQFFTALRLVAQGGSVMAFQDQTGYKAAIASLQSNPKIREQAQRLKKQMQPLASMDARLCIAQAIQTQP